jgi:hypothetical protein
MNKPKVITKEDAVKAMVKTTDKDLHVDIVLVVSGKTQTNCTLKHETIRIKPGMRIPTVHDLFHGSCSTMLDEIL